MAGKMHIQLNDELVLRLKGGDERAFDAVWDIMSPRVLFRVEKLVNNEEQAEEITVDTFMQLWVEREKFTKVESLRKWLYVVSRNKGLNTLRTFQVEEVELDIDKIDTYYTETDYLDASKYEALNRIQIAMFQLSPQRREVIQLAFFKGWTNCQIAEYLKISEKTVKNHKVSGLEILRGLLKPEDLLVLYLLASMHFTA